MVHTRIDSGRRGGRFLLLVSLSILAVSAVMAVALARFERASDLANLASQISVATTARAQEVYDEDEETHYEVMVKLTWDDVYNLDRYVTEPMGEIASPLNSRTGSGGEIGYYDEEGEEWTAGDGGSEEQRETYRQEDGVDGEYTIKVKFRNAIADVDIDATVQVILSGGTTDATVRVFGPEELDDNDDTWSVGTIMFAQPVALERVRSKGCFIATAAYGSSWDRNVLTLCKFRDRCLLTHGPGRFLVGTYERVSPPLARFISTHPAAKPAVRMALLPAVGVSRIAVEGSPPLKWAIVSIGSSAAAVGLLARRRRGSPRVSGSEAGAGNSSGALVQE